MHNNFYFIKRLVFALDEKLKGKTLVEAFSQNKDELMLCFSISSEEDFFIKANLSSSFSCLSFPENYARSSRNSVDLLSEIRNKKVLAVRYFLNERAFYIDFGAFNLVVKLFGRFSNVILFEKEVPTFLFNSHFEEDRGKMFSDYHKDLDQSENAYVENRFENTFPTLRGGIEFVLRKDGFFGKTSRDQFSELSTLVNDFLLAKIRVGKVSGKWSLSLLNQSLDDEALFDDAIEALNYFYANYIAEKSLFEGKQGLSRERNSSLKKLRKTCAQIRERLRKLKEGIPERELADILMANLHQVPVRSSEVELFDFYRNQMLKISLKKDLNAQQNAERYYRRSKNSHLEREKLEQHLVNCNANIILLEEELSDIQDASTYKELKLFAKEQKKEKKEVLPFKVFEKEGFKILVGRNAKNNDLLTLKYAHKNDLWLHAKDVSGSHVVIKSQSGQSMPQYVIEYAAGIAAYYSKRKTDSLCPVTVTPKKYVRKVKGSPSGAVFVEKEEVILVEPKI